MATKNPLTIIGRAEVVSFVELDDTVVVAKVDTGADISSIWASDIYEADDQLHFKLFGPGHKHFSDREFVISKPDYSRTRIANSFGQRELRYVVKLRIRLAGRIVKASFSLADRSSKLYPILLGRRLLKGKFLVDVSRGEPLHAEEKSRKRRLHQEIADLEK
jgi:hypothetical protein